MNRRAISRYGECASAEFGLNEKYSTGNEKVDAMASMQFSGNVIPPTWYKSITRENGKPHLLAISFVQLVHGYVQADI